MSDQDDTNDKFDVEEECANYITKQWLTSARKTLEQAAIDSMIYGTKSIFIPKDIKFDIESIGYNPWIYKMPDSFTKPVCECGWSKTLGKDDRAEAHSDWCPFKTGKV